MSGTTLAADVKDYKAVLTQIEQKASDLADFLKKLRASGWTPPSTVPAVIPKQVSFQTSTPPVGPPLVSSEPTKGKKGETLYSLDDFILYDMLSPGFIVDNRGYSLLDHLYGRSIPKS